MRYLFFIIFSFICMNTIEFSAADNACIPQPTLNPEANSPDRVDCGIEIKQPDLAPLSVPDIEITLKELDAEKFLAQEEKRTAELLSIDEKNKRRVRDDSNLTEDRHQYYLDNFRLPQYTCDLPGIPADKQALHNYTMDQLVEIEVKLDQHYHCINQASSNDREAFKTLITQKLDGKIHSSENGKIRWSVYSYYSEQTKNIMTNIDDLYAQRYAEYRRAHTQVQNIIKHWQKNEYQKSQTTPLIE